MGPNIHLHHHLILNVFACRVSFSLLFLRATTYYLADRRYDMLPAVLSADLCSLLGGVDRSVSSGLYVFEEGV